MVYGYGWGYGYPYGGAYRGFGGYGWGGYGGLGSYGWGGYSSWYPRWGGYGWSGYGGWGNGWGYADAVRRSRVAANLEASRVASEVNLRNSLRRLRYENDVDWILRRW